jgi:hypothetical protein
LSEFVGQVGEIHFQDIDSKVDDYVTGVVNRIISPEVALLTRPGLV